MTEKAVNYVRTKSGLVRAVCECCGRKSIAAKASECGEPDLWNIGAGWSEAPFPSMFEHRDGSIGSLYTCPACNKKLKAGEPLQCRAYLKRDIGGRQPC